MYPHGMHDLFHITNLKDLFRPAAVIAFSLFFGAITGVLRGPRWLACVLPPLAIFSLMSYAEFFIPYAGGGASFWPIGEIVASGTAFVSSAIPYFLIRYLIGIISKPR